MGFPKYEIFTGRDDQFYFRLFAGNGEKILKSEGYTSKSGCENGIKSTRENSPNDERYHRKTAVNDEYYFVLVAANGEPIGVSEMYKSESSRDNGIESVKRTAPGALVEDTT
ncbi:MAG: YegP family protein [Candidatus Marinimicrobia bacterium]|nr:YegP family protein [Candidatus Neomarinimicrobiota bacterium]